MSPRMKILPLCRWATQNQDRSAYLLLFSGRAALDISCGTTVHSETLLTPKSYCYFRFIDNILIHTLTSGSLIRCKHPRSHFGYQYQLYGVQDFRRAFQVRT